MWPNRLLGGKVDLDDPDVFPSMRGIKRRHGDSEPSQTITPHPTMEDFAAWKFHLDFEGYVVITDVLSEAQRTEEFSLFNTMMKECCPGFDEHDSST